MKRRREISVHMEAAQALVGQSDDTRVSATIGSKTWRDDEKPEEKLLTLHHAKPGEQPRLIVEIDKDGRKTFGGGHDDDSAARIYWDLTLQLLPELAARLRQSQ